MLGGLVTAVRTLTIVPVPGTDARNPASALPYFPLVGAALGCAAWAATFLDGAGPVGRWQAGAAALAVVTGVFLTRALHVDGLADLADAAGCMGGRGQKLAVMKDPRVGAFAVTAIACSLGLKWVALARLVERDAAAWVVAAYVVSRAAQVELAGALPYARAEGGTASPFVGGAGLLHRVAGAAVALAILAPAFGPAGVAALVAGMVVARLVGAWCGSRLGGVTGDCLGAASEVVEVVVLLGGAALVEALGPATSWSVLGTLR